MKQRTCLFTAAATLLAVGLFLSLSNPAASAPSSPGAASVAAERGNDGGILPNVDGITKSIDQAAADLKTWCTAMLTEGAVCALLLLLILVQTRGK